MAHRKRIPNSTWDYNPSQNPIKRRSTPTKIRDGSLVARRGPGLARLVQLFEGRNFLTFGYLEGETGLSLSEIIALKPALETALNVDVTSRVDLPKPGFFLES
jgi:hypothetical protein